MALSSDWREFVELLNARDVDYVVVGAHCLAFHGRPRYTGDLDVLVRPSKSNAVALVALLKEFGFAGSKFTPVDFAEGDQVVQLGRPPHRIDLLTSLPVSRARKPLARSARSDARRARPGPK